MSDLGSKAALNSDIDAKVTTNGANENTGARVNDCLNNIVDTLYGSGSAPTATFSTTTNTAQDPGQDTVRFNSGTIGSVTEIALSDVVGGVDKGDLNSRFSGIIQFRPVGTTDTIEFQITSVVHTSWTRYTVTYLKGTLPANGTVCAVRFLPSNTINAAVTAVLAGKADAVKLNGTAQPTAVIDVRTGTTDSSGLVTLDLSAYSAVYVLGGGRVSGSGCLTPFVSKSTLATYSLQFNDETQTPLNAKDVYFSLLLIA